MKYVENRRKITQGFYETRYEHELNLNETSDWRL